MRDVIEKILEWQEEGLSAALATVISAWGSAPRPLGSKMAVSSAGEIVGSVSGGCVEAAVAEEAQAVLSSGASTVVSYGVSNETAWSVGLSCGGTIDVLVEPAHSHLVLDLSRRLAADTGCVRIVALDGPLAGRHAFVDRREAPPRVFGDETVDSEVLVLAASQLEQRASRRVSVEADDREHNLFLDVLLPRPRLVIVGAVHVAIHLVAFAKRLGFRTYVIDPRTVFATSERFSEADELIAEWPQKALESFRIDESTCFAFLSHDLKIDLPGLAVALKSPALYIGALGSKKTHAKRSDALSDLGFSREQIARISAPIGLDLGGRRAEEIALAIMAEIVAVRSGGRVRRA